MTTLKDKIKLVDRFGDNVNPILINKCFGGFSLNEETIIKIQALFDIKDKGKFIHYEPSRHDEDLISIVLNEGLDKSSSFCCKLYIEYIPSEFLDFYHINEYDGAESIELDYSKYLITKLDLIMDNHELTLEQKNEEVNKLRFYFKEIQQKWCKYEMFTNP
jgi:hypothetical protein